MVLPLGQEKQVWVVLPQLDVVCVVRSLASSW